MPPSDFSDIEDAALRHKNRGAILANIFERYVDDRCTPPRLLAKDFAICMREIDNYSTRIPRHERGLAKGEMMRHLKERGYNAT
jgi:hypothetical protein